VVNGILYLVATPIGNLADVSTRAREVLDTVDLVACEDTRRTGGLLAHLMIEARMISFFEGNERERVPELLRELRAGRSIALVSDAGTPGLSDPGYRLVRACAEEGIEVRIVPGASAVISALVISGLPTDRFSFEGFVPRREGERRRRLEEIAADRRTLVFFESPKRIAGTIEQMREMFGNRRAALARELTKVHEEVIRGSLSEIGEEIIARGEIKGEIVLVVEGAPPPQAPDLATLVGEAEALVAAGTKKRQAAQEVAREHGTHPNAIYEALIHPR